MHAMTGVHWEVASMNKKPQQPIISSHCITNMNVLINIQLVYS